MADYPVFINLIVKQLSVLKYTELMNLMNLCTDNNGIFCNELLFKIIKRTFTIPNYIDNLYELTEYLKPRKIDLSISLSDMFKFDNLETENLLLNYFILQYPDFTAKKIISIITEINGRMASSGHSSRRPRISMFQQTQEEINQFDLEQKLRKEDPRFLININRAKNIIDSDEMGKYKF